MVKLKYMNRRLAALAMSGMIFTTSLLLSGCSKKDKNKSDEIGYNVISSSFDEDDKGLYKYYINYDGLESDNFKFSNYPSEFFYKTDEIKEYGTNLWNAQTTASYNNKVKIIWPDCYATYGNVWASPSYFDYDISFEKISGVATYCQFLVIKSSMTAKDDLNNDIIMYTNGQKQIKKGDNFSSVAIYYNGELVAFKQTGAGSDSKNVIDSTVGNIDIAFKEVKDLGLIESTKNVTYEELSDLQNELNDEKTFGKQNIKIKQ